MLMYSHYPFLINSSITTSQQERYLDLDSLPSQEPLQIIQKLNLLRLGQGSDYSLHDSTDSHVLDLETENKHRRQKKMNSV